MAKTWAHFFHGWAHAAVSLLIHGQDCFFTWTSLCWLRISTNRPHWYPSIALVTLRHRAQARQWCQSVYPDDITVFVGGASRLMCSAPCRLWLCDNDFIPLPRSQSVLLGQYIPRGISRKSRLEKDRAHFCHAAFIMCHKCWEASTQWWVSCLSSSCCTECFFLSCNKVYVTKHVCAFATLTHENVDPS